MPTVKEYRDQIDFLENYARELAFSLEGCDKDGNPKPEDAPDMEVDWSIKRESLAGISSSSFDQR